MVSYYAVPASEDKPGQLAAGLCLERVGDRTAPLLVRANIFQDAANPFLDDLE
jgi:hypothetical protein